MPKTPLPTRDPDYDDDYQGDVDFRDNGFWRRSSVYFELKIAIKAWSLMTMAVNVLLPNTMATSDDKVT